MTKDIKQLQQELKDIKGLDNNSKPTYQYYKIKDIYKSLIVIKNKIH